MANDEAVLRKIMPPPPKPVEARGEWAKVERAFATGLPAEYKWFVETYGTGLIGTLPLCVHNAFSSNDRFNLLTMGNACVDDIRRAYENVLDDVPGPLFPEAGGLFPWADTGGGNYVFWKMSGNPDRFGVLYWDSEWYSIGKLSVSALLVKIMSGKLPELFPKEEFEQKPLFAAVR